MPSHRLAKLTIDDLDIIGYSVGGEETVVAIPQLDVCFDIGKAPDQVVPINNVLLTHGHMDHAAGFAYHLSHRIFCGQTAGTILAPQNLIEPMQQILEAWGKLDGNRIPAKLVGVKTGDEYQIKPNIFARVFPVKHSRGAVGYCILEKRKKIKPEFAELTGPEIVALKKKGIQIDNPIEIPIVSYLGDTDYVDFSQLDYITNSKILIAECTFYVDEHKERARAGRHMHIEEFVELAEKMNNEHIVVTHTTQRTSMGQVRKMLKAALSEKTYKKLKLLMDKKNLA